MSGKDGVIVVIVLAVAAGLFFAFKSGFISPGLGMTAGGKQVGTIAVPQPTQNYGGYLAATTAPAVSAGIGNLLTAGSHWIAGLASPAASATPAVASGANPASPTLAAQPAGPNNASQAAMIAAEGMGTTVGPMVDPQIAYDATAGSAFDWAGLSADNAWTSDASLDGTTAPVYGGS
jgi:hypothetical protein